MHKGWVCGSGRWTAARALWLAAVWAGLAAALLACDDQASAPTDDEVACSCGVPCIDELIPATSHLHTQDPLVYPDPPPTGGDHNPCWTTWGYHPEEVPDERWVHNLEHGGVVFLYNCPDGCPDDVAALADLANGLPRTVLTPYSLMSARFAAVSWEHRLLLDCLDADALGAFYDAHFNHGREAIDANPPDTCPP